MRKLILALPLFLCYRTLLTEALSCYQCVSDTCYEDGVVPKKCDRISDKKCGTKTDADTGEVSQVCGDGSSNGQYQWCEGDECNKPKVRAKRDDDKPPATTKPAETTTAAAAPATPAETEKPAEESTAGTEADSSGASALKPSILMLVMAVVVVVLSVLQAWFRG